LNFYQLNPGSDPDPANDGENLTVIAKWVKNTTPYLGLIETCCVSLWTYGVIPAALAQHWNETT